MACYYIGIISLMAAISNWTTVKEFRKKIPIKKIQESEVFCWHTQNVPAYKMSRSVTDVKEALN